MNYRREDTYKKVLNIILKFVLFVFCLIKKQQKQIKCYT